MSSEELSLFSYEVLGLVGDTGAGPHDLRQMVRRGRMLDWAGESRYYVEPKRLAPLGYLEGRKAPGRWRGRDRLLRGAKAPPPPRLSRGAQGARPHARADRL